MTESQPSMIPPPEGAISDEDFHAYIAVIRDALLVHYDREQSRQGLWKDYEAKDQANSIKVKVDRVVRSFEILGRMGEDERDTREKIKTNVREELLDIINYANFAARQL